MEEQYFVDELTNILLKIRALDPEDAKGLAEAFENSRHESFDTFLLEEGFVDKEGLLKGLSLLYQVPYIDVDGYFFQTFLLQKFPKDLLLRNAIIPYQQDGNILIIVAADPSNETLLDVIGENVSYDIQFNVGIYTDIIDAIETYYEHSLTEVVDENEQLRIRDLDNLPGKQEERDASTFVKQKIDEFAKTETEQERAVIEERAHNINVKKR